MRSTDLILRCMVQPQGDVWVATCIDFTLAAQGSSMKEAQEKLHAQIFNYVTDAMTVDREHADVLLSRRAPLADRIRFALGMWRYGLANGWSKMKNRAQSYCEPLPVLPLRA